MQGGSNDRQFYWHAKKLTASPSGFKGGLDVSFVYGSEVLNDRQCSNCTTEFQVTGLYAHLNSNIHVAKHKG